MNAPLTASTASGFHLRGSVGGELAACPRAAADAGEVAQRAERSREGPLRGVVERAVLGDQARTRHDRDLGIGLERRDHRVERALR